MTRRKLKSEQVMYISFILAGVLIGILLIAQFKSSVVSNSYLIDELNAQKELLASFDNDRMVLKNRIAELREQIEKNQEELGTFSNEATLDTLTALKEKLGLTRMRGPGVRILIGEKGNMSSDNNANLIHAADLRDLVNLLRTARIEGLAINGQRITYATTINALGSQILINKVKVVQPFEINVIGDTELIANRLGDRASYPDLFDRIANKNIDFEVEKLNQVVLPLYDGDYLIKFVKNNE